MNGKEKCEYLKEIRKRMAEANGISYEPRECTHEGDCPGTCPVCELETAILMNELKKQEAQGIVIKTLEEIPPLVTSTEDEDNVVQSSGSFIDSGYSAESLRLSMEEELYGLIEPLTGDVRMDIDEDLIRKLKKREKEENRSRFDDFARNFFGDTFLGGDVNPLDEEWDELVEVLQKTVEKNHEDGICNHEDEPF